MESDTIREKFLKFFESKGHKIVPPSLLVSDDPTTLFTTAGMQQFKGFYKKPKGAPSCCVATIQPCLRTSDIEEVGDATHLTFFEMLGNFSFGYPEMAGSYFKEKAIKYGWEFLTKELGIEKSWISATYFKGNNLVPEDLESKKILEGYLSKGLNKITGQGFEDNFWSLGTEGSPGGPTVEFYVDNIEIWNIVFNEYVFKNGKYISSEHKGVDTGLGLERLAVVMQNVRDIFETDLFLPIIHKIEELSGKGYRDFEREFRIIADHIKAAVFAINEGVIPSNKEQGYIIRQLIRKAVVQVYKIGMYTPMAGIRGEINGSPVSKDRFDKISAIIFQIYTGQLGKGFISTNEIEDHLFHEEERFLQIIYSAEHYIKKTHEISGKELFDLSQTRGIPIDISLDLVSMFKSKIRLKAVEEYDELVKKHKQLSRTAAAGMFKGGLADAGEQTTKLHTAAHLLLAALRQTLGGYVIQKGSNITPERLRLDFSHPEKLTPEQIKQVEDLVNEQITQDLPVSRAEMTVDEAKKSGAMGVFEHKYGDKVKVYSIGDFSKEICGGPHIKSTGKLGYFKIIKEESSSRGVRRIKAKVG